MCLFGLPAQAATKTAASRAAKPAPPPPDVEITAPEGAPETVKSSFASVAYTHVRNAAKHIMPNIRSKAVVPAADGGFIASYAEVDTESLRGEILPSQEKDKYIGSIRYAEHQYECLAKTKDEARHAACSRVKSRRMNELIRYEKGKWHY